MGEVYATESTLLLSCLSTVQEISICIKETLQHKKGVEKNEETCLTYKRDVYKYTESLHNLAQFCRNLCT